MINSHAESTIVIASPAATLTSGNVLFKTTQRAADGSLPQRRCALALLAQSACLRACLRVCLPACLPAHVRTCACMCACAYACVPGVCSCPMHTQSAISATQACNACDHMAMTLVLPRRVATIEQLAQTQPPATRQDTNAHAQAHIKCTSQSTLKDLGGLLLMKCRRVQGHVVSAWSAGPCDYTDSSSPPARLIAVDALEPPPQV